MVISPDPNIELEPLEEATRFKTPTALKMMKFLLPEFDDSFNRFGKNLVFYIILVVQLSSPSIPDFPSMIILESSY